MLFIAEPRYLLVSPTAYHPDPAGFTSALL
jgi:hypothetical protein